MPSQNEMNVELPGRDVQCLVFSTNYQNVVYAKAEGLVPQHAKYVPDMLRMLGYHQGTKVYWVRGVSPCSWIEFDRLHNMIVEAYRRFDLERVEVVAT